MYQMISEDWFNSYSTEIKVVNIFLDLQKILN